jgi:hypothetical protein
MRTWSKKKIGTPRNAKGCFAACDTIGKKKSAVPTSCQLYSFKEGDAVIATAVIREDCSDLTRHDQQDNRLSTAKIKRMVYRWVNLGKLPAFAISC